MNIIVAGCGRMGEQVCRILSKQGHEVTVIDPDAKALAHLGTLPYVRKLQGIGFDREVLIAAGIESAAAFVATSPSDNTNIIAARIARNLFHVPCVVTRLYDPRRAEIYRRLGLVTISMINWGAERIVELITHANLDPLLSFGKGEVTLTCIDLPSHLEGRLVRDLAVPGEISVVAVIRGGEASLPSSGTEFQHGDQLYLAVQAQALERLENLLGL